MPASALDLSYVQAAPILPKQTRHFSLYLSGCGGVGSWLAPSVARIARAIQERYHRPIELFFHDERPVTATDVLWQNFSDAEVSTTRASALATRYATAWGVDILALCKYGYFDTWNNTSCLITADSSPPVIKGAGSFLRHSYTDDECASRWWLRILQNQARTWTHLGSSYNPDTVRRGFSLKTLCGHALIEETLEPEPPAPLTVLDGIVQMARDQIAAADAADYVLRWLTGGLKRFSTVHCGPQAWSRYTTPKAVLNPAPPICPFEQSLAPAKMPAPAGSVSLVMVGCGGSGSWLMPSVARIGRALRSLGREVRITAIDFDVVEPANVLRQNFCDAECGRNKAATLADRFSPVFGGEIEIITDAFTAGMVNGLRADTTILIGCVDNAPARRELATTLNGGADVWWLDLGHHYDSGQVVLGSTLDYDRLRPALQNGRCTALPAAPLLHPELLSTAKAAAEPALSCEQHTLRNTQSLLVNQRGAAYAAYYLARFLTGQLDSFATYFDLPTGSALTEWITPRALQAAAPG